MVIERIIKEDVVKLFGGWIEKETEEQDVVVTVLYHKKKGKKLQEGTECLDCGMVQG